MVNDNILDACSTDKLALSLVKSKREIVRNWPKRV
jgi:hypothetical protein